MDPMTQLSQTRQGVVLIVLGLALAATAGSFMKLLSADLSALQITWFRFVGFTLLILPVVLYRFGVKGARPRRAWMQFVRGLTMAAATTAFVTGVRTVDYADAIAILYSYPFLLTLLASLFLGERVRWYGWFGVLGGFAGVLLVMRPEFGEVNRGSLFVFASAVVVSVQMVLNRKLGSLSHPLVTSLWGALVATLALTLMLPGNWQPVNEGHFWLLAGLILTGAISQVLIVFAFARAAASTLAPFTYSEIISAVIIGLVVFGTLPDWISWSGIVLITISGILVGRTLGRG